jgi:hypothetical protein
MVLRASLRIIDLSLLALFPIRENLEKGSLITSLP